MEGVGAPEVWFQEEGRKGVNREIGAGLRRPSGWRSSKRSGCDFSFPLPSLLRVLSLESEPYLAWS